MKKINDIFACKALFFIVAFSIGLWTIRIPTIRDQIQTDYLGIGYIMATFAVGSIIAMLCANYIIVWTSSKNILPPPPENPMTADRIRWEHIQRVFIQCNRNVSETARRLRMHRRTLQRILNKHAPKE